MRLWTRIAVALSLGLGIFWHTAAMALEWEIERNFRYFLYPSDVAVQRLARDIYTAKNGQPPTPEQSELQLNGKGFWDTPLANAGPLRERWPIDWQAGNPATVYDLVKRLRQQEGRSLVVGPDELNRLGWAVLLAEGRDKTRPTGFTATCWNPGQRLHSNCARWGDYVRPPGWIVRIFDPQAEAGQQCKWTVDGAAVAGPTTPLRFQQETRQALRGGEAAATGDCRELRIVVPSDAKDPKMVAGHASVTRTSPDGAQTSVVATPHDRLIIGFGDSLTSGEGNPERPAMFTGSAWTGSNLPARAPDPTSANNSDSRAQWTDRWCHRSVYSWQIRTALDAALRDLQQSVTILPYGCSGATITEGLLGDFRGVEWSKAPKGTIIGSPVEVGLAYQELCGPKAFRSPYCRRGDRSPWCGPTAPPSPRAEAAAGFYDRALPAMRRSIARCGPNKRRHAVRRCADARHRGQRRRFRQLGRGAAPRRSGPPGRCESICSLRRQ